ncbi:MAG: nicotinate-nucleotide adenylyltransferase [Gammaproteobacteria bacterium]|nr:nicotinate-nucleotide adenylyltransferase [Gammaproteobacteria bacterium]
MIGIFGGTFNPVHWGHIRTALELRKALAMDVMLMVPCGIPPHREEPDINPQIRLAMLNSAVSGYSELRVDDRELKREGPSYTVDTLRSLRDEKGNIPLALCVGVDAFIFLDTWHQWKNLIELAHIVVAHRPGWPVESLTQKVSAPLLKMLHDHTVTDNALLHRTPAGYVLMQKVTDIPISSSDIRHCIARGKSIADMVPQQVLQIIERNNLYRTTARSK